jgi:hypothetical protein
MNAKLDRVVAMKAKMRESIVRMLEQKVATATLYGMDDVVKSLNRCLDGIRAEVSAAPGGDQ